MMTISTKIKIKFMKAMQLPIFCLILSSCASNVDDPYTNIRAKLQCPIGYHVEQTNAIVASDEEKDQKYKTSTEFKCVVDLDKNILNKNH